MKDHMADSGKLTNYLLIGTLFLLILYVGQQLFIPMFYGLFIAIVLYPICKWMENHHVPRSVAISIGLSLVIILFSVLVWLLILEFNAFSRDIPLLKTRVGPSVEGFRSWIADNLSISIATQNEWWNNAVEKFSGNAGELVAGVFSKTISSLFMLILTPVFAALFLYNRRDFVQALEKFSTGYFKTGIHELIRETMYTYYHFIKGMILVYLIVGILNSIGLLLLGIEHAILFGFLTAIMTIIPYIGIFISALLPISVAWITKDSIWYPLGVIAVFSIVQYLEANIIFPRVVATQLNISTWATLVAIIAGGILWGVNGMILFIPFTGMLKLMTDHVPGMQPINLLLRRKEKKEAVPSEK